MKDLISCGIKRFRYGARVVQTHFEEPDRLRSRAGRVIARHACRTIYVQAGGRNAGLVITIMGVMVYDRLLLTCNVTRRAETTSRLHHFGRGSAYTTRNLKQKIFVRCYETYCEIRIIT